jgi:hypothetical protein
MREQLPAMAALSVLIDYEDQQIGQFLKSNEF